ncbi:MAG: osmoprotectant transporter permease [Bacteroidota bacterium]|nr:osmoprotectant transporter permease [Bacteroidota bacterium]
MILFWLLWVIDAIVALVAVYFFFVGLGDGSISSSNSSLWVGILLGIFGILFASYKLKQHQHLFIADLLLLVLAMPAVLYGLFLIISVAGNARWN